MAAFVHVFMTDDGEIETLSSVGADDLLDMATHLCTLAEEMTELAEIDPADMEAPEQLH